MPASLEKPQDKPISENIHVEASFAAGRPHIAVPHCQTLTCSGGGEKDIDSPMAFSAIPCDGSVKTLSLTPCDIDYGITPQEVKVNKNGSLGLKGLCSSREAKVKWKCCLSSSEKIPADLQQEVDLGSSVKSLEQTEGNRLDPRLNIPLFFPLSQWSPRYGIQFFSVKVKKFEIIEVPEKGPKSGYAVYTVQVMRGRQVLYRKYRYSQFAAFHEELLNSDIAVIIRKGRISLPSKTWFRNLAVPFLEQRQKDLENYLHSLLRYKFVPSEAIVQKFLCLNEFVIKDFWIDH